MGGIYIMAHGFGVTSDMLAANDLQRIANVKGYNTSITDSVVTIEANDGVQVAVTVNEGAYTINRTDKQLTYKSMSAVIKGINKALDVARKSQSYE